MSMEVTRNYAGSRVCERNVRETRETSGAAETGSADKSADKSAEAPKNTDTLEISDKAREAMENASAPEDGSAEDEEVNDRDAECDESSGRTTVAVNVGKRMRMIAAAENPEQVRVVLELLQGDLEDCKEGLENGWCDEEEVKKVEALIELANKRMAEVAGNDSDDSKGIGAFEMSMLF